MVYFYHLRMRALQFERGDDLDTDLGLFSTREAAAMLEIVGVSRYPSLTMGVVVPGCLEFRD